MKRGRPKGSKNTGNSLGFNKNQTYGGLPVFIVFKNTPKSKIKIKVWENTNVDYINSLDKIPGISENAEILHLGSGISLIEKYKALYL